MNDWLLPFQLPFMQQAFAVTLAVAVPMAVLSCFLVLKGWSLMGDAISHAVLPGIMLAWLSGLPLSVGAFAAGLFCAATAGFVSDNSRIKPDTALGIVFAGLFALGLLLFLAFPSELHLDHILFGDMLGVTWGEIGETLVVGLVVLLFVTLFRSQLAIEAFDAVHARAIGIRTGLLHYALLSAVALVVVGALQAVGIILSIAFLVTPGATAFLITRRLRTMVATSVSISVMATIAGIYGAFWIDAAPAPSIVLLMGIAFSLAFAFQAVGTRRATRIKPSD